MIKTGPPIILPRGEGIVSVALCNMSSFRAKSMGALHGLMAYAHIYSKIMVLQRGTTIGTSKSQIRDRFYSKSKSMIKRLNKWRNCVHFYPKVCTSRNFDLTILQMLKSFIAPNVLTSTMSKVTLIKSKSAKTGRKN